MKKTMLAVGVSVLALAAPASAADGFYMGIGGSYNTNNHTVKQSVAPSSGLGWFTAANRAAINAAPADDISTDAFGAQIFAGYKAHVADQIVLGVEADAAAFDGETEDSFTANYAPGGFGAFTVRQHFSQQWMSTIRAKLGFDVTPNANIYVTGGAAFSDVELVTTFSDTYTVVAQRILAQGARASEVKTGFVYGGGLDWAIGGSTSLRIEYLKADLGNMSTSRALTFSGGGSANNEVLKSDAGLASDSIRIGLAWELNL